MFYKRVILKILKQENNCDGDIFNKVAVLGLKFYKKSLHRRYFSVKFQKIFRAAILQNNYEWLFWYIEITIRINTATWHCVKLSQVRSFFWSVFSRIRTELEDLCSKSPYLTRIRENTCQKNIRVCALFPQWVNI